MPIHTLTVVYLLSSLHLPAFNYFQPPRTLVRKSCGWLSHTHTHTQPFCGPLSETTRVSWYQKKHSPTPTYSDHQPSFISFLRLLQSIAFFLFILRTWQSFGTTSLQVSPLSVDFDAYLSAEYGNLEAAWSTTLERVSAYRMQPCCVSF